jgi:NAD(P)-dependent dehydrogenase (short-subunit alcohol dehydrogenase family)
LIVIKLRLLLYPAHPYAGIGRVTAIAFARAGAAVVLAEADAEAGAEAEQLVLREAGNTSGGKAKFVHCDVSSETVS